MEQDMCGTCENTRPRRASQVLHDHDSQKKKTKKWTLGGLFRWKKNKGGSESTSEDEAVSPKGLFDRRRSRKRRNKQRTNRSVGTFDHVVVNPVGWPQVFQPVDPTHGDVIKSKGASSPKRKTKNVHRDPLSLVNSVTGDLVDRQKCPERCIDSVSKASHECATQWSSQQDLSVIRNNSGGSGSFEGSSRRGRKGMMKARAEALRDLQQGGSTSEEEDFTAHPHARFLTQFKSADSLRPLENESASYRRSRLARTERYINRLSKGEDAGLKKQASFGLQQNQRLCKSDVEGSYHNIRTDCLLTLNGRQSVTTPCADHIDHAHKRMDKSQPRTPSPVRSPQLHPKPYTHYASSAPSRSYDSFVFTFPPSHFYPQTSVSSSLDRKNIKQSVASPRAETHSTYVTQHFSPVSFGQSSEMETKGVPSLVSFESVASLPRKAGVTVPEVVSCSGPSVCVPSQQSLNIGSNHLGNVFNIDPNTPSPVSDSSGIMVVQFPVGRLNSTHVRGYEISPNTKLKSVGFSSSGAVKQAPPPPPRDIQRKTLSVAVGKQELQRPMSYVEPAHTRPLSELHNVGELGEQRQHWSVSQHRSSSDDHIFAHFTQHTSNQSVSGGTSSNRPRPSSVTAEAMRPYAQQRYIAQKLDSDTNFITQESTADIPCLQYVADRNPRSRRPIRVEYNSSTIHDHSYLSDSQVFVKPPYQDRCKPVQDALRVWRKGEKERTMKQPNCSAVSPKPPMQLCSRISQMRSSAQPNVHHAEKSSCSSMLASKLGGSTTSLNSVAGVHSQPVEPSIDSSSQHVYSRSRAVGFEPGITHTEVSVVPKNVPPAPPARRYSRQNSTSSLDAMDCMVDDVSKNGDNITLRTSNLEDALMELEAIYKSLRLGDEDLLDRAERRDLPTVHQKKWMEPVHQETLVDVNETFQVRQRAPSLRRSGIPDKVTDDMAYRRLHPKESSRLPDNADFVCQGSSYLLASQAHGQRFTQSHPTNLTCKTSYTATSQEPDIALDDVVYRSIRHSNNTLKIADPQLPFGIPVGPVSSAPKSDYLHARAEDMYRSTFKSRWTPDVVKDDLAYRSLRKDDQKSHVLSPTDEDAASLNSINANVGQNNPAFLKKKKAIRSLSANLHGLIQNELRSPLISDTKPELEKAQSLSDLSSMMDAIHSVSHDKRITTETHCSTNEKQQQQATENYWDSVPRHISANDCVEVARCLPPACAINNTDILQSTHISLKDTYSTDKNWEQNQPCVTQGKVTASPIDENQLEELLTALAREAKATSETLGNDLKKLKTNSEVLVPNATAETETRVPSYVTESVCSGFSVFTADKPSVLYNSEFQLRVSDIQQSNKPEESSELPLLQSSFRKVDAPGLQCVLNNSVKGNHDNEKKYVMKGNTHLGGHERQSVNTTNPAELITEAFENKVHGTVQNQEQKCNVECKTRLKSESDVQRVTVLSEETLGEGTGKVQSWECETEAEVEHAVMSDRRKGSGTDGGGDMAERRESVRTTRTSRLRAAALSASARSSPTSSTKELHLGRQDSSEPAVRPEKDKSARRKSNLNRALTEEEAVYPADESGVRRRSRLPHIAPTQSPTKNYRTCSGRERHLGSTDDDVQLTRVQPAGGVLRSRQENQTSRHYRKSNIHLQSGNSTDGSEVRYSFPSSRHTASESSKESVSNKISQKVDMLLAETAGKVAAVEELAHQSSAITKTPVERSTHGATAEQHTVACKDKTSFLSNDGKEDSVKVNNASPESSTSATSECTLQEDTTFDFNTVHSDAANNKGASSVPGGSPSKHPFSILKKKLLDEEHSIPNLLPISILKRKTSQDESTVSSMPVTFSPSVVEASQPSARRQGILKKRSSLDESEVIRRRSCSPDVGSLTAADSSEFKPILKHERRSSLEELVRRTQSPDSQPQSILKRRTSRDDEMEERMCGSPEPQGILKRKSIGSSSSSSSSSSCSPHVVIPTCPVSAGGGIPNEDAVESLEPVRPILKKKSSSEDNTVAECATVDTPRPILKKKSSVEVEDLDEKPKRPILKTCRKISQEESVNHDTPVECGSASGTEYEVAKKRILKPVCDLLRSQERSVSPHHRLSFSDIDSVQANCSSNLTPVRAIGIKMCDDAGKAAAAEKPARPVSVAERILSMETFLQQECMGRVRTGAVPRQTGRNRERFHTQPITLGELQAFARNNSANNHGAPAHNTNVPEHYDVEVNCKNAQAEAEKANQQANEKPGVLSQSSAESCTDKTMCTSSFLTSKVDKVHMDCMLAIDQKRRCSLLESKTEEVFSQLGEVQETNKQGTPSGAGKENTSEHSSKIILKPGLVLNSGMQTHHTSTILDPEHDMRPKGILKNVHDNGLSKKITIDAGLDKEAESELECEVKGILRIGLPAHTDAQTPPLQSFKNLKGVLKKEYCVCEEQTVEASSVLSTSEHLRSILKPESSDILSPTSSLECELQSIASEKTGAHVFSMLHGGKAYARQDKNILEFSNEGLFPLEELKMFHKMKTSEQECREEMDVTCEQQSLGGSKTYAQVIRTQITTDKNCQVESDNKTPEVNMKSKLAGKLQAARLTSVNDECDSEEKRFSQCDSETLWADIMTPVSSDGEASSSGGREVCRIIKRDSVSQRRHKERSHLLNPSRPKSSKSSTNLEMTRASREVDKDNCQTPPTVDHTGDGETGGASIAQRLAALQKSGDLDWRKRVSKVNPDSDVSVVTAVEEQWKTKEVTVSECEGSGGAGSSMLAHRLCKLDEAKLGWKKRVEPSDASKFSVAGKMKLETTEQVLPSSPLVGSSGDRKWRIPQPARFKSKTDNVKGAVSTPGSPQKDSGNVLKRSVSAPSGEDGCDISLVKISTVAVPQPDNETFTSFYQNSWKTHSNVELLDICDEDLDNVISHSEKLSSQKKAVKIHRRHVGSRNPVKMLAGRTDLQQEYEAVQPSSLSKELHSVTVVKSHQHSSFALEALAGLASSEDFSSVALRKVTPCVSVMLPYKDLMLLHVKGRRHVQTRLVEPVAASINRGDSYVLVTADQVYHWIGFYSNVIERSRGAEVALHIQQRKDLGCCRASQVITIKDEKSETCNSVHARTFWKLLGVDQEYITVVEAGHPDEDELYESSIVATNMVYEFEENELVPVEAAWGTLPTIKMLDPCKILVLDFGSELYVWSGKNASVERRRAAERVVQELWQHGYDYSECDVCPLNAALSCGCRPVTQLSKTAKQRPEWALMARITQHMETVLLREKFLDWPQFSRIIKTKQSDASDKQLDAGVEIKPCDVQLMLELKSSAPDLELEATHLGRGSNYFDEETNRHYVITTLGLTMWHILEYDYEQLPEMSMGQMHSGDSYVVRWLYTVTVTGRGLSGQPSRHSTTGRDRCAYFCWQGCDASLNEKGAAALLTVELDKEHGPQVRVVQGLEPPAFLNLFQGSMVVYLGKRHGTQDGTASRWHLFICRGEVASEAVLVEVPCSSRHLRSRGSMLLVDTHTGVLYVWHGARSHKFTQEVALSAAENLKRKHPSEIKFHSDVKITIVEQFEGSETIELLEGLGGANRQLYCSLGEQLVPSVFSPRLFQFTSMRGELCVNEVTAPMQKSPYPFLQAELYSANQPALFLFDNENELWLWQGWFPDGDSGSVRYAAERKSAMQTTLDYWKLKHSHLKPKAYLVWAGLEPLHFTNLFPMWTDRDDIAELNIKDGRKVCELLLVEEELARLTQSTYPPAQLLQRPLPDGVDPTRLEIYLHPEHFQELFNITKEQFDELPTWKQTKMKKEVGLF